MKQLRPVFLLLVLLFSGYNLFGEIFLKGRIYDASRNCWASYGIVHLKTSKTIITKFVDSTGLYVIQLPDSLERKVVTIEFEGIGLQSVRIENIILNSPEINLGTIKLFENCCSLLYECFCPIFQLKKRYQIYKLNNPSKKDCEDCERKVDEIIDNYIYTFNTGKYKIINGVIDLRLPQE